MVGHGYTVAYQCRLKDWLNDVQKLTQYHTMCVGYVKFYSSTCYVMQQTRGSSIFILLRDMTKRYVCMETQQQNISQGQEISGGGGKTLLAIRLGNKLGSCQSAF